MKMKVEATLEGMHRDGVKIGISICDDFDDNNLIPEFYIAMLRGMRDRHTRQFYRALAEFSEIDMDEMIDFFKGGEEDD